MEIDYDRIRVIVEQAMHKANGDRYGAWHCSHCAPKGPNPKHFSWHKPNGFGISPAHCECGRLALFVDVELPKA